MASTETALVCNLTALTKIERERLGALSREVFSVATGVEILADGYALAYRDSSPQLLGKIAEFIAYDRLCCSFMRHALVVEPEGGVTWLRLTGGPGAKEFITAEVINLLPPAVATAAGLHSAASPTAQ